MGKSKTTTTKKKVHVQAYKSPNGTGATAGGSNSKGNVDQETESGNEEVEEVESELEDEGLDRPVKVECSGEGCKVITLCINSESLNSEYICGFCSARIIRQYDLQLKNITNIFLTRQKKNDTTSNPENSKNVPDEKNSKSDGEASSSGKEEGLGWKMTTEELIEIAGRTEKERVEKEKRAEWSQVVSKQQKNIIKSEIREINEQGKREANVIIKGLPESDNKDCDAIKKILKDAQKEDISVEGFMRLGRKQEEYNRPVRVYLSNKRDALELIKEQKKLRENGAKIYIERDLTQQEQKQQHELIREMRLKRSQGLYCVIRGDALITKGLF